MELKETSGTSTESSAETSGQAGTSRKSNKNSKETTVEASDEGSVDARYVWNKIVQEQTNANSYTDLQGLTRKRPRGMLRKSFEDCVTFHLFTVFPNNAAEQERYYITNVLKKPQRVNIRQFVQHVEQLNSYILQLPCWYYSQA